MRSERRLIAVVAAAVVALDATTKALATHLLAGRGSVSVLGGAFHLELYRNFAGPRDSFQGHTVLVSLLAIVTVTLIGALAARVRTPTAAIAAGLLLGGGLGNLLDRLLRAPGPLRGGVVDWFRPPFSDGNMNLADLSVAAAVLVFALGAVAGRRTPRVLSEAAAE